MVPTSSLTYGVSDSPDGLEEYRNSKIVTMISCTKTKIEEDGSIKDFFDWVKADGSTDYQPEAGRYHLYGQHMCPFANRATIGRVLKGLENVISYDNVDYILPEGKGWKFSPEKEGCDADSVNGCDYLREVYEDSAKKLGATNGFSGSVTVPALYDKKLQRIVSNDSASILRMFNSEFQDLCATPEQRELDLFPEELRDQIEAVEEWTQKQVIFGVYGPATAKSQDDYNAAIVKLFEGLDKIEDLLSKQRYLVGDRLTEADVRLFVILIRFDPIYTLLLCSKKRIVDYPALWAYTRDIYQTGAVRTVIDLEQTMKGYFLSWRRKATNPYGIVPAPPQLNYDEPHHRQQIASQA